MYSQMLTTLSRGKGENGTAYDDYKPKYPKSIPYYLRDVSKQRSDFPPLAKESTFKKLPGTYLTDKGQMILYTRAKKTKGIEKEAADNFKKISELYDMVHSVSGEFRKDNIYELRKNSDLGDLNSNLGYLKNNWFYPKKWNSPAKELVPAEAISMGMDIKDFLKSENLEMIKHVNRNNKTEVTLDRIDSNSLPNIYKNVKNIMSLQMQNNAANSNSNVAEDCSLTDRSVSDDDCTLNESLNESQIPLNTDSDSVASSSDGSFYDAKEEIFIRPDILKKNFRSLDDKDIFFDKQHKIEITDVLGGDSILTDIKIMDLNAITIRKSKFKRKERNDDLCIALLKNLYEKQNFLSMVKNQFKIYSQSLIQQFQEYNSENRKIRVIDQRKEIYKTIQEMKERNNEIKVRLQKIAEQKILEKKDKVDKSTFTKEWDNMLLELSRKFKLDMQFLEIRKEKLIQEEELKIKENEYEKLQVEHSSIIFAFTTLKNELMKIEEEKNDIEHFIIRLEMGRENVNKIEREISTLTPAPFTLNKNNFQSYFKKLKEETVLNWQSKMHDSGNLFKVEESKLLDMLTLECEQESSAKEKDVINYNTNDININAMPNEATHSADNMKFLSSNNTEDLVSETDKSTVAFKNQKNYYMKLDYELMKIDQRISANYTYSYFVPWPRENYERDFIDPSTLSDSDDENIKTDKSSRLNYKRILAHNPLKEKKTRKCRK